MTMRRRSLKLKLKEQGLSHLPFIAVIPSTIALCCRRIVNMMPLPLRLCNDGHRESGLVVSNNPSSTAGTWSSDAKDRPQVQRDPVPLARFSSSPYEFTVVLSLRSFALTLHGRSAALVEEVCWGTFGTFLTSCERRFGVSLPKGSDFLSRRY